MMKSLIILFFTCACMNLQAQVNIITTIAGKDTSGYSGDGGLATNAKLYAPAYVCLDNLGSIYISDAFNHRIRKMVLSTGIITTVAGNGTPGYNGDNIQATDAQLLVPEGICIDTKGNLYFADGLNHRIRKITFSTGVITTVAGNGIAGNTGDGGMATNATLNGPVDLCIDSRGSIYIADYYNEKIRKIDALTNVISTVAGNGTAGYNGDAIPAINAQLSGAVAVFADSLRNIFICDQWNHRIRKVDALTGIITTVAGTGTAGYSGDNGPAISAQLNQPANMFIDRRNNIFMADFENAVIRKIDGITGLITTVAGTGVKGYSGDGGPATDAKLKCDDVCLDSNGTMFIADVYNHRIRMVYNPKLSVRPSDLRDEIMVYPNPTRNEVIIENADGNEIGIYSILGQEVFATTLSSDKQVLNLECLSSGMYVVEVVNPLTGFRMTKQLIISK